MTAEEEPRRIPWTGEFTPGQLGSTALTETLDIIQLGESDRDQIVEAIRSRWFVEAASRRADDPDARLRQQRIRSSNVLNGMQNYGLVDSACQLTTLGREVRELQGAEAKADRFVAFLLKHRQGFELLQIVRDMQNRGTPITNDALREELRRRGYAGVTTNSGDAGKLRQWLETAGVIDRKWQIDETRVAAVSGVPLSVVADWQSLTRPQQAFLKTIRRLSETRGTRPTPSPELLDFVRQEHGPVFNEGQVKKIYYALQSGGWITHTVKPGGRGGKGGLIAATQKLTDSDFEVLLGFAPGDLPADLRAALTTPLDEVRKQLLSTDTYVKGIALELIAVNLASDLGLSPLRLRVRGTRTGGAEVDLVAEGAHLHFSRWLFQCKNTRTVDVGVLAKEVGMATLLQAQVIVIATTGSVSATVQIYARRVNETTPFQVVIIDQHVLSQYWVGGALALREQLRRMAVNAMTLKRPQVVETLQDLVDDES